MKRKSIRYLTEEDSKEKSLECPYCDSMNTKFINQEEADPDDNGTSGYSTQYELRKNYVCNDCGCKFHCYEVTTVSAGVEIDEKGRDEFIIDIELPRNAGFCGFHGTDVEKYLKFDFRNADYDEELPEELDDVKDAIENEDIWYCPTIQKEIKDLKSSYPEVKITLWDYIYDGKIYIEIKANSLSELKALIRGGEDSPNTLEHLIHSCFWDYLDRIGEIHRVVVGADWEIRVYRY